MKLEALVTAKTSRGCSRSFLDLLGRFRSDEKGEICHSDNVIKTVGEFLWEKTNETSIDDCKNVMNNMRVNYCQNPHITEETVQQI